MSAASRRSPVIPLSPPSPPSTGVKERSKPQAPEVPQPPSSPPFMSVATKSYAYTLPDTQSPPNQAAPQRSPSPPTSASIYTQDSHHLNMNSSNNSPTPASSINELSRMATIEDEDEHRNKRLKMSPVLFSPQNKIEVDERTVQRFRGQHAEEAVEAEISQAHVTGVASETSNATEVATENQLASDDVSLEQLQKDMGDAFLLCKSVLPRSRPNPSQHLLSLYRLSPLHATVARTDPRTGEKINKLRKSYEGKIKEFELAGRNKPVKIDIPDGEKGKLRSMMEDVPEEQWQAEKASKSIEITPSFQTMLNKAMQMQPGTVRNNEMWEDALGHEKPRPPTVVESPARKVPAAPVPPRQANTASRPQVPAGADPVRPRRVGKKRSYNDNSFEGYGDGFVDDDGEIDVGAYSNSEEGGHGPGRKKRKKEHVFSISPTSYERPSYGVGGFVNIR